MTDAERWAAIEGRLAALENEIQALRTLVAGQGQVIGQALQNVMGSGSTVPDPHPEDVR